MTNAGVMIALTEAKTAVKEDDSLEDRLRAAMRVTSRHWCVTNPDEQLRAAVGAVLVSASPDESERIEAELANLRSLSALLEGVPVDLERIEPLENPIGVMKLWHEVADGQGDAE